MRIGYYIHSLSIGGAETIVTEYLVSLKKKGHHVFLIVDQYCGSFLEKRIKDNDIRIYCLDKEMPEEFFASLLWKIRLRFTSYSLIINRIIQCESPDIIHAHSSIGRLANISFPIESIFFTIHSDINRYLGMIKRSEKIKLKRMALRGLQFIALTHVAKDAIQELFPHADIVVIPNGEDLEQIRANAYDRKTFLEDLRISADSHIIGHIGRFHPVKNHERILSIFHQYQKRQNNSYLILVGGDYDNRQNAIKKKANDLGLSDRVIILGMRPDANRILNVFDTLLFPSFSECFPLTLIEAQAIGINCVISDTVPHDVICNSNCVAVSLQKDDAEWVSEIINNETLESINTNNNKINQFDLNSVLDTTIDVYKTHVYKTV